MAGFRQSSGVWEVGLSNDEVRRIGDVAFVAAISTSWAPTVSGVISATAAVIKTVNEIGGNRGVKVVGVFQTQLVTVTPAFVSPFDFVQSIQTALVRATGLPQGVVGAGIGAGIALLAAGPAATVVGGLLGYLGVGGGGPNPGDVHADRAAVGPWEKFLLVTLTPNNVALASWRGYFCAEDGGGGQVHANRELIGPWETATLIRNANGTVSLRSQNGHYLVAENGGGGGSVCNWNRRDIGEWEQFWMEFQPDGFCALKTFSRQTFVSVQ